MNSYQLPKSTNFETNIDGKNTHLFILKNRAGMQIAVTDYGARLVSALVPDNKGNLVDVILGFDNIHSYLNAKEQFHGATIGRVANRISNGKFELDDIEYTLNQNNHSNSLHGGPSGFHTKVWDRQLSYTNRIDFYYTSKDGEEGYPGEVKVNVSYEITNDNEIIIRFRATSDKPTVINLTNHAYFNLNGESNGNILNHDLQINSKEFIPITKEQIPTGGTSSVANTVFDFTKTKKIGQDINKEDSQLVYAQGYDHSFINSNTIKHAAASVSSDLTGIHLDVYTDLPTLHFYSGNFLAGDESKQSRNYSAYSGFCLEAQHYIDSPNQPNFPSIILRPSEEYLACINYRFSVLK